MTFFLQFLLSGLMLGGIYGLIALGIVLIYKSSRVFNFAHPELVVLGAFVVWTFVAPLKLHFGLAIIAAIALCLLLAIVIERLILRPMTGQPLLAVIMATIGLSQVVAGVTTLAWPGPGRAYPPIIPSGAVHLGGIVLAQENLISFAVCIITFLTFLAFFRYTKMGLAMRGTAEDAQLAQSGGIKVTTVFTGAWFIGMVLAVIGGVLLGNIHTVDPMIGGYGIAAFAAVFVGGLESIPGAIISGLIIGVLQMLGAGYIDAIMPVRSSELIPYVILLLILLAKPFGLFGYERIERV